MNYGHNMPDWQQQQYSTLQSGEAERHQASAAGASITQQQQQQTVQPGAGSGGSGGHLYSLPDCLSNKPQQPAQQQNDGSFYGRGAAQQQQQQQPASSPMGHHPHMSGCHGYGPAAMGVMDTAVMGEDMQQQQQQQQRAVQMSLSSPTSRIGSGAAMHGPSIPGMGQIMPPTPSMPAAARQSSYGPCKGACCQPPNPAYRWDKMNPYQAAAASSSNPYRESGHPSAAASSYASSRYRSTIPGFPLDQQQQQQQAQQQQQQQRRYTRKESSQVSRTYHHQYPMQNPAGYGFPTTPDYQKYYAASSSRPPPVPQGPGPGMIKYGDPGLAAAIQDKYLNKQSQYQTANGAIMQNGVMVPGSMPPSPYYNPQMAHTSREDFACKEAKEQEAAARLGMSLQAKHMYQQKLAMQRMNIENHLREFSRMPGYQSHPKYQEYHMKYRECIRLQQSLEYPAMQPGMAQQPQQQQQQPAQSMPPINLQFDQNGVLINSSLMPGYNPAMQTAMPGVHNPMSPGAKDASAHYDGKAMQAMEHAMACASQQQQQPHQHQQQHAIMQLSPEQQQQQQHHHHQQSQQHYLPHHEYHHQVPATHHAQHMPPHHHHHHHQQQPLEDEAEAQRHKTCSKDFADKPQLDVRQFLESWDETEEEDALNGNLQDVILTDSTPIVVLEYGNLIPSAATAAAQTICVSEPAATEPTTAVLSAATTKPPAEKDQIAVVNNDGEVSTAEQIPTTVNIIRCITSADDVPTIHIVDTLENEAVVKKIEGAFHSLNPADIKSIEELVNKSSVTSSATGNKEERISLSFLNAATILQQPKEASEKSPGGVANDTAGTSSKPAANEQQQQQPQSSEKKNQVAAAEKNSGLNLSDATFVNEDTRNHDDLSLPELPTSECTPISTTLNTPNHSDNEESSERVRVMSLSTNSMEIMPSSPIISFAHSPIKFQKTSGSDELQFDFQNSNEASNASVLKDAKESNKGNQDAKSQSQSAKDVATTSVSQSQGQHCSSVIETAVFSFSEFSNSNSLQLGEEPKMPAPPMEDNCLTNIIKDTPPITDLRVLESDDDIVDKVNDIWMDINLENSLSNSSSSKLGCSEEKHAQTDKLRKIRKTSLRHFRKSKGGIIAIEQPTIAEKSRDSITMIPSTMPTPTPTPSSTPTPTPTPTPAPTPIPVTMEVVQEPSIVTKTLEKERETRKSLDSALKTAVTDKPKKRAKSVELDVSSNPDQEGLLKEFQDLKRKRSIGQIQDQIAMLKSSIDELRNLNHTGNNNSGVTSSSANNNNVNINNSANNNNLDNNDRDNNVVYNKPSSDDNSSFKNASLPMLPDTKSSGSSRRSFSSIFDEPSETSLEKVPEESSSRQCVDSDIKIQLSNVNLQFKDKKETNSGSVCNTSSSKEGIKIEINVSRVESQRLHDNEVVSKSNQHLNISLPPTSPMSCKVDCHTSISTTENEKETVKLDRALPAKEVIEEKAAPIIELDKEDVKLIAEEPKVTIVEEPQVIAEVQKPTVKDSKIIVEEPKVIAKEPKVIAEETKEEEMILTFVNKNAELEDSKCLTLENKAVSGKNNVQVDDSLLKKLEKKESDIENALKKLDECRRDSIHEEKEVAPPSKEPEFFQNKNFVDTPAPGCSKDLDFDNFDVEPFDDKSDDYLKDLLLSSDSKDHHRSNSSSKTVGYFNPLFHLDELENLNTVPVYTTKDGKITYSPNPNYTYRALIIEARQREGHQLFRDFYDSKSNSGRRSRHYSSSKSQDVDNVKKHGKSSHHKYKYEGKKEKYNEDVSVLSFENCIANENLAIANKRVDDEPVKFGTQRQDSVKHLEDMFDTDIDSMIIDNKSYKSGLMDKQETAIMENDRLSPVPLTPPPIVLRNDCADKELPLLDDEPERREADHSTKSMNRCIVDLQNLKEDILKKLNDQVPACKPRVQEFEPEVSMCDSAEIKETEDVSENRDAVSDKEMESDVQVPKEVTSVVQQDDSKVELYDDLVTKIEEKVSEELQVPEEPKSDQNDPIQVPSKLEKENPTEIPTKDVVEVTVVQHVILKTTEPESTKVDIAQEAQIAEVPKPAETKFISIEDEIRAEIAELAKPFDLEMNKEEEIKVSESVKQVEKEIKISEPSDPAKETDSKILQPLEPEKIEVKSPKLEKSNDTESKMPEPLQLANIQTKSKKSPSAIIDIGSSKTVHMPSATKHIKETPQQEEVQPKSEIHEKPISPESSFPRLPCSIDKSNFSFELCDRFINQEKNHTSRNDAVAKTVPKLVLRKSETNPKFFSKSMSIDNSNLEDLKKDIPEATSLKSPVHPKIPKMIIRNAKSRPSTPSIEEISENSCSFVANDSGEQKMNLKVKIRLDEKGEPVGRGNCQNSCDSTEAKVPKMKIKLEENLPRVVIESIDPSSLDQLKTVPKMKITNVKGSLPKIKEKRPLVIEDGKSDAYHSLTDNECYRVREKSRSKSKKDSPGYWSSSECSQKRSSSSSFVSHSKKVRRSPKEEVHLDPNLEDTQFMLDEYRQQNNSNSCSSVSTKVPKVIIKRTSPSAEFKCELSKEAIVNQQPQVVLRRSWVLDCMAKDLRHMKLVVKVANSKRQEAKREAKPESNEMQWKRFISGLKKRRELSRSNSTSDLSPPKIKRRRTSDYTIGTLDYSDSDSSTRFDFAKNKYEEVEQQKLTRRSSLNLASEVRAFSAAKTCWKSLDENMNSKSKMDFENDERLNTNVAVDNKKLETIPEASNSYSSEFSHDANNKSANEKSEESSLNEIHVPLEMEEDDSEILDKDVDVHEEEIDGTMDDFETNESSVIKLDSSDESQTTIEILPASPEQELDVEQHKKDIEEEEQIYSEDAMPMHFEYELEVGASPVDPLEVPLPGSEVETDKSSSSIESKQIPGILIHEQLAIEDNLSGNTSLNEEIAQPMPIDSDIPEENPSIKSENSTSNSCPDPSSVPPLMRIVDEASSTSTSLNNPLSLKSEDMVDNVNSSSNSHETTMTTTTSTTEEEEEDKNLKLGAGASTACSYSDLLVKEVLAAKETLKKYLGNLTSDGNRSNSSPVTSRPKSKTETKHQGSTSYEMSSLAKYGRSTKFRHRDKWNRLNGKSRSSDVRASRTSSSNDPDKDSSSNHTDKSSHRKQASAELEKTKNETTNGNKSSQSKSYKIPRLSKTQMDDSLTHAVEENLRQSREREKADESKAEMISEINARAPQAMITMGQSTNEANDLAETQAVKRVENVISRSDESNFATKAKALQLNPEMTISNIVRELVFHDKATIRHRRYCMLCERWFPSTLRHRRHLAGYQHRHTELTQRRAIHMLFLIFTGNLCPKLLPPHVVRTDCVPGELTPLQIAVQDFASVFDGAQQILGKQNNETKE
ncbi:uncharacterized protein LOC100678946 isoform X2 [Nasonia vitripennis]|uniref:Uncharacterized protein n=1 Tax=Nasonia vitripennis TaxID=7425 RepID=A0A7M7H9P1_NASVI|nr:uncharacterized protein LOC100678946 isoform X2 [Nasonia vitripennis]